MIRNILYGAIALVIIFGLFTGCIDENISSQTLYVDANGGHQFTSIQEAIDAAENNMTIFVYNGIYHENLNISNKSIILKGEDNQNTIIDGTYSKDVVLIWEDAQVVIMNFTLRNSGNRTKLNRNDAVIDVHSSNNTIHNNIIQNGNMGIYLTHAKSVNITHNIIEYCKQYGVYAYSSSDNMNLIYNEFRYNECGTRLKQSDNCKIVNNMYENNQKGLYFCCGASSNIAYHNSFINNSDWNAYDYVENNDWYMDYPEGGNYWDDYNGTDLFSGPGQDQPGSDGIGDEPYVDSSKKIDDLYPLMDPYL